MDKKEYNKFEALEIIYDKLLNADKHIFNESDIEDNHPSLNEKWLLMEAQARILEGENPTLVLKNFFNM